MKMQREGLKNVDELQSYFINRIDKFLISKNKKMIGWDEIMKGGLPQGATVMSWNGIAPGIEAAKEGHDVIMTPTKYCYFDYYQANPEFDTLGTGGVITLKDVYSYNPVPNGLTNEEAEHILGAQANLWTEYVKTPERAEHMILPRMLALSEDVWSGTENKNWNDFLNRINEHFKIFDEMGLKYSRGSFDVNITPEFESNKSEFRVSLTSEQLDPKIYYTTDGTIPGQNSPVYSAPFYINRTTTIKASILEGNKPVEGVNEKIIYFGKELGKKVLYTSLPAQKYSGDNADKSLIDGIKGTTYFYDGNWQGFLENNFDVIIDLDSIYSLQKISINFLHDLKSWIFLPKSINISTSKNGIDYDNYIINLDSARQRVDSKFIQEFSRNLKGNSVRYIHVIAKNNGICPAWHVGAGEPAWLFCDEILIE